MATVLSKMLSQLDQILLECSTLLQPRDLQTPYSHYTVADFVDPQDHGPIGAIVAERQSQMVDLQTICHKLSAIRAEVEERQTRVQESLTIHRGLLSSFRRLPPETLLEIFYHCLPEDTAYTRPNVDECPLVLTRVCQHWRSVAIATPQLWSSLEIYLQEAASHEYRLGCQVWLARAGGLLLALKVQGYQTKYNDGEALTRCKVDWLQPLVARCRDLHWIGPSLTGLFTGNGIVDSLEELHISDAKHSSQSAWGYPWGYPIHVPGPADRLKFVTITLSFNIPDDITLPWKHLTELHMKSVGLCHIGILRFLDACTDLWQADFVAGESTLYNIPEAVIPGSVVNHSLKCLAVSVPTAPVVGLLFDALVLPSLEELAIDYGDDGPWPHVQFMSFLTCSGCPLKKLTIWKNNTVAHHISEYRARFPSLSIRVLPTKSPRHQWKWTLEIFLVLMTTEHPSDRGIYHNPDTT